MKINITGKNVVITDKITEAVEKRFQKLGKYFADDILANVIIYPEKSKIKMETTIHAKGVIFRAENVSQDIFDAIDIVCEKLTRQMSRYKDKLVDRKKGGESIKFDLIPDAGEVVDSKVVKKKKFVVTPMSVEEAALQMELLGHNFFVFIDERTNEVNIVYKRNDGDYGDLEAVSK